MACTTSPWICLGQQDCNNTGVDQCLNGRGSVCTRVAFVRGFPGEGQADYPGADRIECWTQPGHEDTWAVQSHRIVAQIFTSRTSLFADVLIRLSAVVPTGKAGCW